MGEDSKRRSEILLGDEPNPKEPGGIVRNVRRGRQTYGTEHVNVCRVRGLSTCPFFFFFLIVGNMNSMTGRY